MAAMTLTHTRSLLCLCLLSAGPLVSASLSPTTLPNGTAGVKYSQTVVPIGVIAPLTCTIVSGQWPSFMSITGGITDCTITANDPPVSAAFTFVLLINGYGTSTYASQEYTISFAPPLAITTSLLPGAVSGSAYTTTLVGTGGAEPYLWNLISGSFPPGLSLYGATIAGTPTTAGTFSFTVQVNDSGTNVASQSMSLSVSPPLSITTTSLPGALATTAYSQSLAAAGGTPLYAWSLASGSLPAGLTLSTGGSISGTPTTGGTFNFTVQATDSTSPTAQTAIQPLAIVVGSPLVISTTALPNALASAPYSLILNAAGGTAPYKWTIPSGSLPSGLSLSSSGTISGTPTTVGSATFVIQVSDATVPAQTSTAGFSLTVSPALSITTSTLPTAVFASPYSQLLAASGGTPGYTWTLSAGSLPTGLTLSSTGIISGTPTASGTTSFTITATDTTLPNAQTTSHTYSITVGAQLAIQTNALAIGFVGGTYIQSLSAAGGTTPFTWSLDAGPLPDGLTIHANGTITGTPTVTGSTVFVVRVTDATTPTAQTATQTLSIYVAGQLTIDTTVLPDATAAHPYAQPLTAHNGVPPYAWARATGTLPPGISLLATGALIGTPNVAGTYSFTLAVSDSTAPTSQSATQAYTLTVNHAFSITTTALPGASSGVAYSAGVQATDGQLPYSFAIVFGSLPPGLTLSSAGQITGTPTKPGIYNLLIRASDSTSPSAQTCDQPISLTVDSTLTITTASLPDATQGLQYTNTLTALNGLQPYTWAVTGGTLPDGLSLLLSGTIVGLPTKPGTFTFTIQATDSSSPSAAVSTRSYTLLVQTPLTITTASLPNALTGSPYVAIFTTTGGQPQYTYSITDGVLPPGLSMDDTGVIQGTPTIPGAYTFTIQASDSSATPSAINRTYIIAANQPLVITTLPELPPATLNSLYSVQLTATGGMTPYAWRTDSTLPSGLQLLSTGVIIGVPSESGTFPITLHLSDGTSSNPQSTSVAATLTVTPPLVISATPFPSVLPSVPYSAVALATGGVPPYTWSIAVGSLPPGLTLNSDGTLAGVATSSGAYDIQLTVTDSASPQNSATQEFVLLVADPFAITTTSPVPNALLGKSYSQVLAISGGKAPFVWSVVGGSLPTGVSLTTAGTLSGSPTVAGTAQFVVQCKDAANETAVRPLTLTIQPTLGILSTAVPAAVAKSVYFHLFQPSDGTPAYHWSVSNGSLPPGLTLTDSGLLTGTATTTGAYPITLAVTDTSTPAAQSASTQLTITVIYPLTAIAQSFSAYASAVFSQSLTATGGTGPYVWTVASGTLPNGLTLTTAGTLSGTPTKPDTFPIILNVTDSTGLTAAALYAIVVTEPLGIPLPSSALPTATSGVSYAAVLSASGGSSPYTWSVTSGSLPPGLTLSSTGVLSGTPSAIGSYSFAATVTDAASQTTTKQYSLTVHAAPAGLTIPPASAALPAALVGTAYVAPLTVTWGTAPYTWSLASGASLPTGFFLNGAAIIGTPTTTGTYTFAITVKDTAGLSATSAYVLTVGAGLAITKSSFPSASVGIFYADNFTAAGGTAPYTWVGVAPFGLTLSSTGLLSGTPTGAGSTTITVTLTDSSKPSLTVTASVPFTVIRPLIISTTTTPRWLVGTPSITALVAQGGATPYNWKVSGGSLPPGLTLSTDGTISGTPTKAGTYLTTVAVSDAYAAPQTTSGQILSVVIDALSITNTTLATAITAAPYSEVLTVLGGTPPYTWSGSVPFGLQLTSNGVLSGTPTAQGSASVTLTVTDSSRPTLTTTKLFTLTVAQALTITSTNPPQVAVGTSATITLQAQGGTGPYTWTVAGGILPPGLTVTAAGAVTGTPTKAGTYMTTLGVHDASATPLTATAQILFTVVDALTIVTTTLPTASTGLAYSATVQAQGGTTPYTWSLASGALPVGLTLNGGTIAGRPSAIATSTFVLKVTDANGLTATQSLPLTVAGVLTITTTTLPQAPVNTAFSYTLLTTGGTSPYTWTVLSGSVPPGLTLTTAGTLSGTPSAPGSYSLTVKATDAGTPQQSATAVLTATITSALSVTTSSIPQAAVSILYRVAFTATGGVSPTTWRLSSGTLPTGLTLTSAGILTGTPVNTDTQTITIQVTDSQNQSASAQYTLIVAPAPILSLQITPAGSTIDPLTQHPVQLALGSAYPAGLTGKLVLSGTQDPDATFIQNGQHVLAAAFVIPSGATTSTFSDGPVILQSGTSSSAITVTAITDTPQQSTSQQFSVLPLTPQLTSGQYTTTADGFVLTVHGFSTTRELQTATFRFSTQGASSAPFTMSVADLFHAWYETASSAGSGTFLYRQPFRLTGTGAAPITSVAVTLTNSVGTSSTLTLTPEAQ
jgi:hypothetical protein